MRACTDIQDLKGKKVLLRVDFNIPVEDSIIVDDFRIKKTIPTIEHLRARGAKVILISHFESKESNSLKIVSRYLHTFFPVTFVEDIFSDEVKDVVESMQEQDVVLFDNLRKWKGEKENDPEFSKHLASFADVYVNEAFSASHRKHASIVGVPQHLPSYTGEVFADELQNLRSALEPKKPFLFILGGAKFSTKLPLLKKFLQKADHVVVSGALMNNFYKAQGFDVGASLVEEGDFGSKEMLENKHLYLPTDVVVQNTKGEPEVKMLGDIQKDESIMDVGPQSLIHLQTYIKEAQYILWNGPLGNYEKGYGEGTKELAHRIAESGKTSIIGGGDTISVVSKLNLFDKFTFVSTAGGAMLDFLANETLPGIKALEIANSK